MLHKAIKILDQNKQQNLSIQFSFDLIPPVKPVNKILLLACGMYVEYLCV